MTNKNTVISVDANATLAYKFWLERCFQDGSPEEDMFRAVCVNSGGIKPGERLPQPLAKNGKQELSIESPVGAGALIDTCTAGAPEWFDP